MPQSARPRRPCRTWRSIRATWAGGWAPLAVLHTWTRAPRQLWSKNWVVHCKAAGQGRQVLYYLARYVFRVAISNSRLERFANGQVTFRYRDNRSQQLHRVTLPAQKFILPLPAACAAARLCQGQVLRYLESYL